MIGNSFVPAERVDERFVINDGIHIADITSDRNNSNRISSAPLCYSKSMTADDIDSPGSRLRFARKSAGFESAKRFAAKAGINEVTCRAYENDQIGFASLAPKFARLLGVTTDWLLEGGPISDVAVATPMEAYNDVAMVRQVDISYAMGDGSVLADYPETGMMPFARNFLEMLGARASDHLFISRGEGDSMSPTIFDNDLVMVDTSKNRIAMQDRIWALTVAGAGMIKRLRALPDGKIMVLSDNPSVPEQIYDVDDVYVVGKVIWIGRRM